MRAVHRNPGVYRSFRLLCDARNVETPPRGAGVRREARRPESGVFGVGSGRRRDQFEVRAVGETDDGHLRRAGAVFAAVLRRKADVRRGVPECVETAPAERDVVDVEHHPPERAPGV